MFKFWNFVKLFAAISAFPLMGIPEDMRFENNSNSSWYLRFWTGELRAMIVVQFSDGKIEYYDDQLLRPGKEIQVIQHSKLYLFIKNEGGPHQLSFEHFDKYF